MIPMAFYWKCDGSRGENACILRRDSNIPNCVLSCGETTCLDTREPPSPYPVFCSGNGWHSRPFTGKRYNSTGENTCILQPDSNVVNSVFSRLETNESATTKPAVAHPCFKVLSYDSPGVLLKKSPWWATNIFAGIKRAVTKTFYLASLSIPSNSTQSKIYRNHSFRVKSADSWLTKCRDFVKIIHLIWRKFKIVKLRF